MNKIVNKFVLEEDKSIPEMDLRQPGFTYSAVDLKKEKKIQKFKETRDSQHIY